MHRSDSMTERPARLTSWLRFASPFDVAFQGMMPLYSASSTNLRVETAADVMMVDLCTQGWIPLFLPLGLAGCVCSTPLRKAPSRKRYTVTEKLTKYGRYSIATPSPPLRISLPSRAWTSCRSLWRSKPAYVAVCPFCAAHPFSVAALSSERPARWAEGGGEGGRQAGAPHIPRLRWTRGRAIQPRSQQQRRVRRQLQRQRRKVEVERKRDPGERWI